MNHISVLRMNKLQKPSSIKRPQGLITTPKPYESWKICQGRKIYSLVESIAACKTAGWRAHICAHAGTIPEVQGLMQEVSAVQSLEIREWAPEKLCQNPNLSCCQVLCHPEGDSGNLEGWRFHHVLTPANVTSVAAPVFNSQKLLLYRPILAPFYNEMRILLGCKRVGG